MDVTKDEMPETPNCSEISVGVSPSSTDSLSNSNLNQVDGYQVQDKTILNNRSSIDSDLPFPSREPSLLDELRTSLTNKTFMKLKIKPRIDRSLEYSLNSSSGSHNSTLDTDKAKSGVPKLNLFSLLRKDRTINFTLRDESSSSIENEPANDASMNLSKVATSKPIFKRPQSKRVSVKFDCDVSQSDDSKASLDQDSVLDVTSKLPEPSKIAGLRSTRSGGLRKRHGTLEHVADFTLSNSMNSDTSTADTTASKAAMLPTANSSVGDLPIDSSISPETIEPTIAQGTCTQPPISTEHQVQEETLINDQSSLELSLSPKEPLISSELQTNSTNGSSTKQDTEPVNPSDSPIAQNSTLDNEETKLSVPASKKLFSSTRLRKKDVNITWTLGDESSLSIDNDQPNESSVNLSKIAKSKPIFKRLQSKKVSVKFDCEDLVSEDSNASIDRESVLDERANPSKIAGLRSSRSGGSRKRHRTLEHVADFTLSNSLNSDTSTTDTTASKAAMLPTANSSVGDLQVDLSISPETIEPTIAQGTVSQPPISTEHPEQEDTLVNDQSSLDSTLTFSPKEPSISSDLQSNSTNRSSTKLETEPVNPSDNPGLQNTTLDNDEPKLSVPASKKLFSSTRLRKKDVNITWTLGDESSLSIDNDQPNESSVNLSKIATSKPIFKRLHSKRVSVKFDCEDLVSEDSNASIGRDSALVERAKPSKIAGLRSSRSGGLKKSKKSSKSIADFTLSESQDSTNVSLMESQKSAIHPDIQNLRNDEPSLPITTSSPTSESDTLHLVLSPIIEPLEGEAEGFSQSPLQNILVKNSALPEETCRRDQAGGNTLVDTPLTTTLDDISDKSFKQKENDGLGDLSNYEYAAITITNATATDSAQQQRSPSKDGHNVHSDTNGHSPASPTTNPPLPPSFGLPDVNSEVDSPKKMPRTDECREDPIQKSAGLDIYLPPTFVVDTVIGEEEEQSHSKDSRTHNNAARKSSKTSKVVSTVQSSSADGHDNVNNDINGCSPVINVTYDVPSSPNVGPGGPVVPLTDHISKDPMKEINVDADEVGESMPIHEEQWHPGDKRKHKNAARKPSMSSKVVLTVQSPSTDGHDNVNNDTNGCSPGINVTYDVPSSPNVSPGGPAVPLTDHINKDPMKEINVDADEVGESMPIHEQQWHPGDQRKHKNAARKPSVSSKVVPTVQSPSTDGHDNVNNDTNGCSPGINVTYDVPSSPNVGPGGPAVPLTDHISKDPMKESIVEADEVGESMPIHEEQRHPEDQRKHENAARKPSMSSKVVPTVKSSSTDGHDNVNDDTNACSPVLTTNVTYDVPSSPNVGPGGPAVPLNDHISKDPMKEINVDADEVGESMPIHEEQRHPEEQHKHKNVARKTSKSSKVAPTVQSSSTDGHDNVNDDTNACSPVLTTNVTYNVPSSPNLGSISPKVQGGPSISLTVDSCRDPINENSALPPRILAVPQSNTQNSDTPTTKIILNTSTEHQLQDEPLVINQSGFEANLSEPSREPLIEAHRDSLMDYSLSDNPGSQNGTLDNEEAKLSVPESKKLFSPTRLRKKDVNITLTLGDESSLSIDNDRPNESSVNLSKIAASKPIFKRLKSKRVSVKFDCDDLVSEDSNAGDSVLDERAKPSKIAGLRNSRSGGLKKSKKSLKSIADFTLSESQDSTNVSQKSSIRPEMQNLQNDESCLAITTSDPTKESDTLHLVLSPIIEPFEGESDGVSPARTSLNESRTNLVETIYRDHTNRNTLVDHPLATTLDDIISDKSFKQNEQGALDDASKYGIAAINTTRATSTDSAGHLYTSKDGHNNVHSDTNGHSPASPTTTAPLAPNLGLPNANIEEDVAPKIPCIDEGYRHPIKESAVLDIPLPPSPFVDAVTGESMAIHDEHSHSKDSRKHKNAACKTPNTSKVASTDSAFQPPSNYDCHDNVNVDTNACSPAISATNDVPLLPNLGPGAPPIPLAVDSGRDLIKENTVIDTPVQPLVIVDGANQQTLPEKPIHDEQSHSNDSRKHKNAARKTSNTSKVASTDSAFQPPSNYDCHDNVDTNACGPAINATQDVPPLPNLGPGGPPIPITVDSGRVAIKENTAIDTPVQPVVIVDGANQQTLPEKLPTSKRKRVSFKPAHQNTYHSPTDYHNNRSKSDHSSSSSSPCKDGGGYDEFSKIQMTAELSEIQTSLRMTRSKKHYSSTPLPKSKKQRTTNLTIRREARSDNHIFASPVTITAPADNDFLVPPPPLFATKPTSRVSSGGLSPLNPVNPAEPSPKEGEKVEASGRHSSSSAKSSVDLSYEQSLNISAIPRDQTAPKWGNVFHSTPKNKLKKKGSSKPPHRVDDEKLVDRSINTSRKLRSRSREESQLSKASGSSQSRDEPGKADRSSRQSKSKSSISMRTEESSIGAPQPLSSSNDNSSPNKVSMKNSTVLSSHVHSNSRVRDFASSRTSRSSYLTRHSSQSSYDSHRKMPSRRLFTHVETADEKENEVISEVNIGSPVGRNVSNTPNSLAMESSSSKQRDDDDDDGNSNYGVALSSSVASSSAGSVAPYILPHKSFESQISTLRSIRASGSENSLLETLQPNGEQNAKCAVEPKKPRSKFSRRKPKSENPSIFPKLSKRRRAKTSSGSEEEWLKKPRKLYKPGKWASKKFYLWLENKLRPEHGLRTTLMAEKFVIDLQHLIVMADTGHMDGVIEGLRQRTVELKMCTNEMELWSLVHKWMPLDFRMKVIPLGGAFNSVVAPRRLPYDPVIS